METTLLSFEKKVMNDMEGKVDYLSPINNLHLDDAMALNFIKESPVRIEGGRSAQFTPTDIPLELNEHSASQILSKLGMPVTYFKKAYKEDPELVRSHFNYWAHKSNSTVRVRSIVAGNGTLGIARAVVSEAYTPFDNREVMDLLQQFCDTRENVFEISDSHLDDERMHLRVTMPLKQRDFAHSYRDINRIGFDVVNSEVGCASFNIQALIWRLVCLNGLRAWRGDGDAFNQRHIYVHPEVVREKVAASLRTQMENAGIRLLQFEAMREKGLNNSYAIINRLADEGQFGELFRNTAISEFEMENTAYGVINAFTRASRELSNEKRLEAEEFAGSLIHLPIERWERLDQPLTAEEELKYAS